MLEKERSQDVAQLQFYTLVSIKQEGRSKRKDVVPREGVRPSRYSCICFLNVSLRNNTALWGHLHRKPSGSHGNSPVLSVSRDISETPIRQSRHMNFRDPAK